MHTPRSTTAMGWAASVGGIVAGSQARPTARVPPPSDVWAVSWGVTAPHCIVRRWPAFAPSTMLPVGRWPSKSSSVPMKYRLSRVNSAWWALPS
ncbi:MAG: hypothetical protein M3179_04385, partial [Actinomycetota bacterium]|nr:hypothetical protein [Actinomycetota bacterium]